MDASVAEPVAGNAPADKGLKKDVIGFGSGLAISLDSVAPAYSLAAVIGIIVATAGLQAPAVLLVAFVPMFLVATAFAALNRSDPDCGTTFSWVTRAMGPIPGWVAGWAVAITGILVIGSLADTAALYTYILFGLDSLADSPTAVALLTVVFIAVMTAITIFGTELSARLQVGMVTLQITALIVFAVVTLAKIGGADAPAESLTPSLSWVNPFEISSFSALAAGLLTAVFIYWGWESAVNVNEETSDSATSPGKAAVVSTMILLATYLLVAYAVIAWFGSSTGETYNDDIAVLADAAAGSLGGLDFLVVLAVLTSALAATQTTILPASRTSLSMAARGAFPRAFATIHPRYRTPWIGTAIIGVLATLWYLPLKFLSENFLFDTITALGIMIAFYYAITGFACVIYYRRRLRDSTRNMLVLGAGPAVGALILTAILVKAIVDFADVENSYSGALLGVGPPLVIGVGFMLLGVVGVIAWKLAGNERFFSERRSVAPTVDPPPVLASDPPPLAKV